MEPTGNGFKDKPWGEGKEINASPGIFPSNLIIPTNKKYPAIEEIIKNQKNAFLIDLSFDCDMGNTIDGDIGGNIDLGYKIKNGKITGRVKNKRFAGNIYNLLGKQFVTMSNKTESTLFGYGFFPYFFIKDVSIT